MENQDLQNDKFAKFRKHIVICPHCEREVLDHMTECPFCHGELTPKGYTPMMDEATRKRVKWIVSIVIIIGALIAVLWVLGVIGNRFG